MIQVQRKGEGVRSITLIYFERPFSGLLPESAISDYLLHNFGLWKKYLERFLFIDLLLVHFVSNFRTNKFTDLPTVKGELEICRFAK